MNSHSEGRGKALLALPTLSLNTHSAEDRKEAGVGGRSQGQGTRQGPEDPGLQSAVNLKSHAGPWRAQRQGSNTLAIWRGRWSRVEGVCIEAPAVVQGGHNGACTRMTECEKVSGM